MQIQLQIDSSFEGLQASATQALGIQTQHAKSIARVVLVAVLSLMALLAAVAGIAGAFTVTPFLGFLCVSAVLFACVAALVLARIKIPAYDPEADKPHVRLFINDSEIPSDILSDPKKLQALIESSKKTEEPTKATANEARASESPTSSNSKEIAQ